MAIVVIHTLLENRKLHSLDNSDTQQLVTRA